MLLLLYIVCYMFEAYQPLSYSMTTYKCRCEAYQPLSYNINTLNAFIIIYSMLHVWGIPASILQHKYL